MNNDIILKLLSEYKETEKKTDKNFFEKFKKFLFNN